MKDNTEINGVLYLPALGLLISCMAGTWNYFKIVRMFWMKMTDGQPVAYWFAAYMIVAGAIYLMWTWYAAILFYRQKKRTRKAMLSPHENHLSMLFICAHFDALRRPEAG
jgi:hypothetical protein